jgi:Xaa-Pro aminopeptidase
MSLNMVPHIDVSLYNARMRKLIEAIKKKFGAQAKGAVVLIANFESDTHQFVQESSFFYLTGIREPGVILVHDLDGVSTLCVPQYAQDRSAWMNVACPLVQENANKLGVTTVKMMGEQCKGYSFHHFFKQAEAHHVLEHLTKIVDAGGQLFSLLPNNAHECVTQRFVIERLTKFAPHLAEKFVDISPLVAALRRTKDNHEIERLYEAIGVTAMAQEAAAQAITSGVSEWEVQGALEYIFVAAGATPAFPSIVASGKNGTILHYTSTGDELQNGDMVIVDIGARVGGYCADLTRTYPVSGTFTKRQRELYSIVLQVQQYLAEEVHPGMWLNNPQDEENSLQHLAKKLLKARGLDQYFTHGIGHFLGLDVHDVGDSSRPLQEGDVFTLEPGIYIPAENIGIRIEDDYWMVKDAAVCLSEDLPRELEDVEKFMKEQAEEVDDDLEEGQDRDNEDNEFEDENN